jgi:hypothetical protein
MMKKFSPTRCAAALAAAGALAAYVHAQEKAGAPLNKQGAEAHAECPLMTEGKTPDGKSGAQAGGGHDAHLAAVNARGEAAMGFSQTETAHHFLLKSDGGAIQVEVKDAADAENLKRVRRHLAHVARMFAAGDFDTPMLVHARTVPGTPEMSRLRSEIAYAFEETERGGRVLINAKSAEALAAVHQFLRFQIEDHRTGDPQEL